MTNEEAIEVLKLEKYGGDIRFYGDVNPVLESAVSESGYFSNAIDIAIDAIKAQIPKKPKIKDKDFISYSYDCPCCEGYLVSVIVDELCVGAKYEYCPKCGQKLDWSEE